MWDAIVVGAGPAGCAAAYDVAAAGRRVLLVDTASFPRAKACAGALTRKAVRALRYSIAPVVRMEVSEAVLEHRSAPGEPVRVARRRPFCAMTVRAELDAYCLEQTRGRGAVFRRVGVIAGIEELADRVRLQMKEELGPLEGRFVIGADGVHSRVRALTAGPGGARWFRRGFAVEANVPYAETGRSFPFTFDFAPEFAGYGWLFPRNDHVNVGLYTADAGLGRAIAGLEKGGAEGIDRAGLERYIEARCGPFKQGLARHGGVTGQFLGLGAAGYAPGESRVLLVGDAAGFVDPLTGEGIHGAIVSGQAAAAAVLGSLDRADSSGAAVAELYRKGLRRQVADLAMSEKAAAFFYGKPAEGLRLMRLPLAGRAVLHAFSEGTSLQTLARGVRLVGRLVGGF
jgi:geranylgeranyl reductase family protein